MPGIDLGSDPSVISQTFSKNIYKGFPSTLPGLEILLRIFGLVIQASL